MNATKYKNQLGREHILPEQTIIGIVATTNDNLIGRSDGSLPWDIPEELKLFRKLTLGSSVIMGRKTWDALGRKPLPGRTNYILTTGDSVARTDKVIPVGSVEEFLDNQPRGKTFVIGGAEVYLAMVPFFDEFIITFIRRADCTGDVYLPDNLFDNNALEFIETIADTDDFVTERFMTGDK